MEIKKLVGTVSDAREQERVAATIAALEANVLYLSMMTDVELPSETTEETIVEEVE